MTRSRRALTAISGAVLAAAALTACSGGQEVSFPDPTLPAEMSAAPTATPDAGIDEPEQPQAEADVTGAQETTTDLTAAAPQPEAEPTMPAGGFDPDEDPRSDNPQFTGSYNPDNPWNELTPTLDRRYEPIQAGQTPPPGYVAVPNGLEFYLDVPPVVDLPSSGTVTLIVGQVAAAEAASANYDTITTNSSVITGGKGRIYDMGAVFRDDPTAPLLVRAIRPGTATLTTDAGTVRITVQAAPRAGQ